MNEPMPSQTVIETVLADGSGALEIDVVASRDAPDDRRLGTARSEYAACTLQSIVEDVWLCAPGRIVLSLAGCTYCDGHSLGPIVWLWSRAGERLEVSLAAEPFHATRLPDRELRERRMRRRTGSRRCVLRERRMRERVSVRTR